MSSIHHHGPAMQPHAKVHGLDGWTDRELMHIMEDSDLPAVRAVRDETRLEGPHANDAIRARLNWMVRYGVLEEVPGEGWRWSKLGRWHMEGCPEHRRPKDDFSDRNQTLISSLLDHTRLQAEPVHVPGEVLRRPAPVR